MGRRRGPLPRALPQVSPDNFEHVGNAPGSYVSRWVVGVGCDMMAICQLVIFWINESAASRTGVRSRPWLSHKFLLGQSVLAIFCLSWVGAICDSTVDTCRGNNSLHTTFAVTFFALYDLYMLTLHIQNSAGRNHWIRNLCLAATLASKLRWIPAVSLAVGDNALAIVEWTDVSIILAWTVHYIIASPLGTVLNYGEAYITEPPETANLGVLSSINARVLTNVTVVIMIGTLVTTLIAGIRNGVVTKERVPWISDLWVYPPGNWISRWAVVQGCHAAVWVHVAAWQAGWYNESGFKKYIGPLFLPLISIFGLSVVGCVNEDEDHTIHVFAAGTFFVCYDLFMVYVLLAQIIGPSLPSGFASKLAAATVALASQLAIFVIFPFLLPEATQGGIMDNLPQILEWTNAFAIITFMYKHVYNEEYTQFFWMVVYSKDQSATATETQQQQARQASIELETKLLTGEV